ncbi:hypothetical protein FXN63_04865 [Pigmentiphaga aceris]|uniref:Lipoprotein n=1 Tax=Pigmentiphaga aceris TaxID=1940612 RepID=A0A5C0AX05_9BURK|nr:hypothetical protein [Pigmentiphaga aceris]QEI05241.1 hypothetical protein FXN63_04865 [Pigmentiphaga aceris]
MPSTPTTKQYRNASWRPLATIGVLSVAVALAACTKDPKIAAAEAVADGTALKQVKALVDGRAQCARVMYGWEPFDLTGPEDLELPSMRALMDAGLIERTPNQPAGERPTYRSTATPEVQAQVRKRPLNQEQQTLDLCYGKRQVTRVWVDEKWSAHGSIPYVQYAYRIVEPPKWATPHMRQTFPFLERALTSELVAQDMLPVKDGKVEMSLPMENVQFDDDMIEVFSICPDGVANPGERCQRVEEQRLKWKQEREKEEKEQASPAQQTAPAS